MKYCRATARRRRNAMRSCVLARARHVKDAVGQADVQDRESGEGKRTRQRSARRDHDEQPASEIAIGTRKKPADLATSWTRLRHAAAPPRAMK